VRHVRHQPVIANLEKELVQLIWIVKAHSNGVPLRAKQKIREYLQQHKLNQEMPLRAKQKTREYLQQHKLNQEMVLHAQLQQTVNEETELVQQAKIVQESGLSVHMNANRWSGGNFKFCKPNKVMVRRVRHLLLIVNQETGVALEIVGNFKLESTVIGVESRTRFIFWMFLTSFPRSLRQQNSVMRLAQKYAQESTTQEENHKDVQMTAGEAHFTFVRLGAIINMQVRVLVFIQKKPRLLGQQMYQLS